MNYTEGKYPVSTVCAALPVNCLRGQFKPMDLEKGSFGLISILSLLRHCHCLLSTDLSVTGSVEGSAIKTHRAFGILSELHRF